MRLLTRLWILRVLSLFVIFVVGLALFGATAQIAHAVAAPTLTLSHSSGPPTTTVNVNGSGFGAQETIVLTFDSTSVETATSDATGAFSTAFSIPADAQPGTHIVQATGKTSGSIATKTFLVQTDWAMFGFKPQHEHVNPYENVLDVSNVSGLAVDWAAPTGNYIFSSPAVFDGVVYVGSYDHKVYAFNADTGAELWSFTTGSFIASSPTVVKGMLYIGSYDQRLYALNATTGRKIWSYRTNGEIYSSPTVANGVIYVGSDDSTVYAFDASTGTKLWSYTTGSFVLSSPALVNGMLYIGSIDHNLYAFHLSIVSTSLKKLTI